MGKKLPRNVVMLGLVSLLTDAASEMCLPLFPLLLAGLGAGPAFLGLIEGAADGLSALLKLWSGAWSDRMGKRKPPVVLGYALATLARPLNALAGSAFHVLGFRLLDRVGKGLRSAPRDALIAESVPPDRRGEAFGFHRAMDHAGAAIGTLLGAGLLWYLGAATGESATADQMRTVFLWAAVPGGFAMIALALTREPPRSAPLPAAAAATATLPPALKRALLPMALFAFANATDAFIIVKAARLGASPILAPLLWLALHVIKASTATAGGRLADRYGRRNALVLGWSVYAVTWGAVGFAESLPVLFVLTAIYGTSHGLVEGAEKALIAELAAGSGKGRAFGSYNMLIGLAALAASTTFGVVWDRFGSAVAFTGSGAVALVAAGVLLAVVPKC